MKVVYLYEQITTEISHHSTFQLGNVSQVRLTRETVFRCENWETYKTKIEKLSFNYTNGYLYKNISTEELIALFLVHISWKRLVQP